MKVFSPEALAVAKSAQELATELHHDYGDREHVLLALVEGKGGDGIRNALEACGFTAGAVRSAIGNEGSIESATQIATLNNVYRDPTTVLPYGVQSAGRHQIDALAASRLFLGLTLAANTVFQMAFNEAADGEVDAWDVLYVLVRGADHDEHTPRIMQVINQVVPGLTIEQLKSNLLLFLEDTIPKKEHDVVMAERFRAMLMYTGTTQEA